MGRLSESKIYEYFSYDTNSKLSVCKDCGGNVNGKHGTNLKKHLSIHVDLFEEFKKLESKKNLQKNNLKPNLKSKAHYRLFNFSKPNVQVSISMKHIIDACVELVTVNGRPFSMLNDSGLRRILDPVLNGVKNSVVINSESIGDLEKVSTFNPGLDDGEISDLLNENFDDVDEQYEKTEKIVTDIVAQNIGDEIFTGVRCVAHTLQLAVIDSLKGSAVEKLLNKVRILVKKLRNQTYLYLIKKEKLKSPVLDCLTRWHSTLDMLERVKYLKLFILNISANDSKLNKLCLSNFEWQQVDAL
ncbi:hypothetical protein ACI65C_013785 [Semiaphis heraclei]